MDRVALAARSVAEIGCRDYALNTSSCALPLHAFGFAVRVALCSFDMPRRTADNKKEVSTLVHSQIA